jgi:hypothetical protein
MAIQWILGFSGGYLHLVSAQEVASFLSSMDVRRRNQSYSTTDLESQTPPEETQYRGKRIPFEIFSVNEIHQDSSANECENKQKEFEGVCNRFFLSKQVTQDGLISQGDYTSFLSSYCSWKGKCSAGEELDFESLPMSLQLTFTKFLCTCDETLCQFEDEGNFGIQYNSFTNELVESQILTMCSSLFSDVCQYITHDKGMYFRNQ